MNFLLLGWWKGEKTSDLLILEPSQRLQMIDWLNFYADSKNKAANVQVNNKISTYLTAYATIFQKSYLKP